MIYLWLINSNTFQFFLIIEGNSIPKNYLPLIIGLYFSLFGTQWTNKKLLNYILKKDLKLFKFKIQ
jgi:hypothetical protein